MASKASSKDSARPPGKNRQSRRQVAGLRAERDAAVAALNKQGRRRARRLRARQVSAVLLVVVFAILRPLMITATWAHRTVWGAITGSGLDGLPGWDHR